tara:strand:- start:62379 stop:62543 length:165 start_codon:yes stop_codon:yes gene_type:complete
VLLFDDFRLIKTYVKDRAVCLSSFFIVKNNKKKRVVKGGIVSSKKNISLFNERK